jgi:signal transduction histidine kinase
MQPTEKYSRTHNLSLAGQDEIFCIDHEAARNACLHSKVKGINGHRRDPVLRIADDGIGIDKETLLHGRAGHSGLVEMRERAERIGAVLHIRSSKAGTLVQLVIPSKVVFRSMP